MSFGRSSRQYRKRRAGTSGDRTKAIGCPDRLKSKLLHILDTIGSTRRFGATLEGNLLRRLTSRRVPGVPNELALLIGRNLPVAAERCGQTLMAEILRPYGPRSNSPIESYYGFRPTVTRHGSALGQFQTSSAAACEIRFAPRN